MSKPLLHKGCFVFCTGCNKLIDKDGNAIDGTHCSKQHQEALAMKPTDCNECKRTAKWKKLSISEGITLTGSLHNQIRMNSWKRPMAGATV